MQVQSFGYWSKCRLRIARTNAESSSVAGNETGVQVFRCPVRFGNSIVNQFCHQPSLKRFIHPFTPSPSLGSVGKYHLDLESCHRNLKCRRAVVNLQSMETAMTSSFELTGAVQIQGLRQAKALRHVVQHLKASIERLLRRKQPVERFASSVIRSQNERKSRILRA